MPERKLVEQGQWLYRRGFASPEKKYMNPDGTATSRVFKLRPKDNGALSVDVKSLTTPEQSIGDPKAYMLFEINNDTVTELDLQTFYDPCNVETHGFENPAHALIEGMDIENEITPGLLARKSRRIWI
jgi:hypothetical protein